MRAGLAPADSQGAWPGRMVGWGMCGNGSRCPGHHELLDHTWSKHSHLRQPASVQRAHVLWSIWCLNMIMIFVCICNVYVSIYIYVYICQGKGCRVHLCKMPSVWNPVTSQVSRVTCPGPLLPTIYQTIIKMVRKKPRLQHTSRCMSLPVTSTLRSGTAHLFLK